MKISETGGEIAFNVRAPNLSVSFDHSMHHSKYCYIGFYVIVTLSYIIQIRRLLILKSSRRYSIRFIKSTFVR